MKTTEFCPKCYYPLGLSEDDGRLCEACHWFGDQSEICATPPAPDNLELAFTQLLALYRDICRIELVAEQLTEGQANYEAKLRVIQARVGHARHSILHLFRTTKGEKTDEETPT